MCMLHNVEAYKKQSFNDKQKYKWGMHSAGELVM